MKNAGLAQEPNRAWNPRYRAYAAAHGRTPDEQMDHDRSVFPGGKMAGFMIWMSQQWQDWATERGVSVEPASNRHHVKTEQDHAEFDERLRRLFIK